MPFALSDTLQAIVLAGLSILLDAGFWIVASLIAAGFVYEYLGTSRLSRFMRHQGAGSLAGALAVGALLPICSCGVIPLAISLRLAGVRLAAVMTFAAATPVINPAAVLLSYALLGPQITMAYVLFGLTVPILAGLIVERFGSQPDTAVAAQLKSCCCGTSGCAGQPVTSGQRFVRAVRWGVLELGPTLGLYLAVGIVLAAFVVTLTPSQWIPEHLGAAAPLASLLLVAVLGMIIYVCAVAHIPLVAALLLAGASPGVAIVFLVTGAVTNLPELIALQRILGRRAIAVYVASLVAASVAAGWLLNLWLLPDFSPRLDPLVSMHWSDLAARATFIVPQPITVASAAAVGLLCIWGVSRWVRDRVDGLRKRQVAA